MTELFDGLPDPQDTHEQRFEKYNNENPEIYWAIKAMAYKLLQEGNRRLSMKGIFELLRGKFPHLNNSYTADYTDLLIKYHPQYEKLFERRKRADGDMRLVYKERV
jgi:hypothetical protein